MNFQNNYRHLIRFISLMVLCVVTIMMIGRIWLLLDAADSGQLSQHSNDLWHFFFISSRFDLRVATIAFAPLLLAGLFCAIKDKAYGRFLTVSRFYSTVIFFLVVSFTIGNFYYYQTYGNYFDVFVFGLFDDDTQAVVKNMWSDYPILRSLAISISITFLSTKIINVYSHKILIKKAQSKWFVAASVFIMIFVYASLARGSLGTLPLKRYHANVSQYSVMNKAVPNAFMALDWARTDYRDQATFEPVEGAVLKSQMLKVLGKETPTYRTPYNAYLEANKPNVVMTLMESMGMNVLVEDDPSNNDLLGSLRQPFTQDFLFTRFEAGTSATIDSIVMMLLHSNVPTISHSSVQTIALPSSAVLPYKKAGYEVSFIYGGNGMWRNLSNYLPLQGFDHVYDEINIKAAFPEAKGQETTWGVIDEFVFKFAEKLLKEANKPQMIYIMTTTNHPPFELPKNYQPNPVSVSPRLAKHLTLEGDEKETMLKVYQYASNAFGNFINDIKSSKLSKNTILAASGDHKVRNVEHDIVEEDGIENAVPFYLYIPKDILENVDYQYDNQRIGSHRDVFPTLYHFSLSDKGYISLGGENLLTTGKVSNIGYNTSKTLTELGAYKNGQPQKLYKWGKDNLHTVAEAVENTAPNFAREYNKLQDLYLRSQVTQPNKA